MAVDFFSDVDVHGFDLVGAGLKKVKLLEFGANPSAYQIGRDANGVPLYINSSGVQLPFHENSILAITGTGPIHAPTSGRSVTLEIDEATPLVKGAMSPANVVKLAGATNAATASTLVMRDANGSFLVPEIPAADGSPISKSYFLTQLTDAIADSEVSITGELPFTFNPVGNNIEIGLALANGTTKGALSPELFTRLNSATAAATPSSVVLRDSNGNFAAGTITASKLTGLSANPQDDSEAVSKLFVTNLLTQGFNAAARGMAFKQQTVAVAVTTNVDLTSGFGVYDGVTFTTASPNKSVLLTEQTDKSENGPYDITDDGLVRRADSTTSADIVSGTTYRVAGGSLPNALFTAVVPENFTIDVDDINFIRSSSLDETLDGDGLTKVGSTLHVGGTTGQIVVDANKVGIASTYAGQPSITTVGTIASGAWNGTQIPLAYGGTNATNAPDARTNLGLGTISTQNANAINITGGTISGITDLGMADGGTGASTAPAARTNLGAAASGANSDITSLSGLTSAVSIAQGGTNATTAVEALTNLGAVQQVASSLLGNGVDTSFTFVHGLDTLILEITGYYMGKQMGGVDFDTPTDRNEVVIHASLGGTPVAANAFQFVAKAVKGF